MTRSKKRKLLRQRVVYRHGPATILPVASVCLILATGVRADDQNTGTLEEVVVTAQKRTENLQDVPISVIAIDSKTLDQLQINDAADYVKFLPSVSTQGGGGGGGEVGPGFGRVIMRGVNSDSNLNHSGPLPTVGTYLDDQPITTIQGALDLHLYDIERVEALAGPQGTLYGASSEAGTVRIITNKPDAAAFKAGYEIEANTIDHGQPGGVVQGFVNVPLADNAALRVVGWWDHSGGYINNIEATRTFPQFGITIDNADVAKNDFNPVDVYGARAALKVDLNDSWTITPMIMGQETRALGFGAYNPALGDLNVEHFSRDFSDDHFFDAALTVEGKISNFDLVYTGAFLKRNDIAHIDYSDYSLAYDISIPSYTSPIVDNSGAHINPTQMIWAKDRYKKQSHELRLSSPQDWPVRFITGIFYQWQQHGIEQRYVIDDLATDLWVTGWPDTWWLTEQLRTDRDYAAFGEVTVDLAKGLSLTGGLRLFRYDNSLEGFRGFGLDNPLGAASGLGEAGPCNDAIHFNGAPCLSFAKSTGGGGGTPKLTLTYKFDPDKLIYATYSEGFRPGGINRVGDLPPYKADFLKNYEIGWKTTWLGNRLRFNGAFFWEDWDNFQFSFLGNNSLTEIANAGKARIQGAESELDWAVTKALTVGAGVTILDPRIIENYCGAINPDGSPITSCPTAAGASVPVDHGPFAPAGTQLPGTSKFKTDLQARYTMPLGPVQGHVQAAFTYQSAQWSDLRIEQREEIGPQPAYGELDLSVGATGSNYTADLFVTNAFDRRGQTFRFTQCNSCSIVANYAVPTQPRTIGLKFGQNF